MDINYRGKGWPPIYFDPDFNECIELTKSFDTLRIGLLKEKDGWHLVIASGYGNTHSTLAKALGELNPRCEPSRLDGCKYSGLDGTAIFYLENGRYWFNLCDLGKGERVPPNESLKYFPQPVRDVLKDIVKLAESNLRQEID